MSSFHDKAFQLLKTETVSLFSKPERLVILDSKTSLHDGFQTLLENNIISAPVYDETTKQYTGFIDIRDLVSFVVFVYDNQKVTDNVRLQELLLHGVGQFKMITTEGVTLSYLSRRHKFRPVLVTDKLETVAQLICQPDTRRVPVVDSEGRVINIISQSSLIKLIAAKCTNPTQDDPSEPTIAELPNVGIHPVLSVNKSESVINTFRYMDIKNKSGLALVDDNGRFVGTTTGKDLGHFLRNPTLGALTLPIFEHLKLIRNELVDIKSPAIAVFEKDKLSRAVSLLAATGVHRIFVCDSEEYYRPIRIIAIQDILRYFINKVEKNEKQ